MDNPLTIVPSAAEYAYGPIADSYAQKYGIPTDVFRNVVKEISGFNPDYKGPNGGRGIANLDFSAPDLPNPDDVGGSLDFLGKIMKGYFNKTQDWQKATDAYFGRDEEGQQAVKEAQAAAEENSFTAKAVAFLKNSAFTIIIVLVGLILILGSTWMIINQQGK